MKLSRRDIVKLGVATGASTLLPDFLSAVDAETQYRVEGQSMVTKNVIQRVFKIRRGESQGTAFTIDRAGRQYLVTARHVIESVSVGSLSIWHEEQWKALAVNVVGVGEGEVDVAVLAPLFQISPMHLLETADSSHTYYGQQVHILGFPHGHDSGGEEINRGLPIPFVKSGIISAFAFGDVKKIYIDTHANEGFSGGPVVFHPQQGARDPHELRVAGVVTGYIYHNRVLNDADGNHWGSVRENTGIAVAVGVQHATDLIDANQIGCELPAG